MVSLVLEPFQWHYEGAILPGCICPHGEIKPRMGGAKAKESGPRIDQNQAKEGRSWRGKFVIRRL